MLDIEQNLDEPALMPRAAVCRRGKGMGKFSGEIVCGSSAALEVGKLLAEYLSPAICQDVSVKSGEVPTAGAIFLMESGDCSADEFGFMSEEYELDVLSEHTCLHARNRMGLLRGIQTLRQLFSPEIYESRKLNRDWLLPVVQIRDTPRFRWRGLLFDVSRHFFSVGEVCRFIELAAQQKYNVLHWHLTDDQGWRVEIRKYPLLTQKGAFRPCSEVVDFDHMDANRRPVFDRTEHGGFYSQQDIKRIVEYAERRGVLIVPEIDMPGHIQAAIAAYPGLGCPTARTPEVKTTWGTGDVILNPSQQTISFLKDVLSEIIELFPSRIVHIGGDEVAFSQWENFPEARKIDNVPNFVTGRVV